jgi:hypothetical protein
MPKENLTPLQQATARLKAQNDQLELYLKGQRGRPSFMPPVLNAMPCDSADHDRPSTTLVVQGPRRVASEVSK